MDGSVDVFVKVLTIAEKPRIQGKIEVLGASGAKSTTPSTRFLENPWILPWIFAKSAKKPRIQGFLGK